MAERPDDVERALERWLERVGMGAGRMERLTGDVSTRRYFRVWNARGDSFVAAHYPAELAGAQGRFTRAAGLLASAGVRVPDVLVDDAEAGFALVEDLGPRTLYECEELDWSGRAPYVDAALAAARRIATLPETEVAALGSPPLGGELLGRELDQTVRLFLAPRELASEALVSALRTLCDRLAADRPRPCHRDLMVRNLLPVGSGEVAVLDFQDLRLGPPAYDLASLLNDSWFAPRELEARWVAENLPRGVTPDQYRRAVAQRALKAVGTFAAFAARGQTRHRRLVGPTLARALAHLVELPETAAAMRPLAARFAAETGSAAIC